MAKLMPLPLTVSCFSKIQIGFTFLVQAHPGSPGQRAVKRLLDWFLCVFVWKGLVYVFVSSVYSSDPFGFVSFTGFSFLSTKPRDLLGSTSVKWIILCRLGRRTLLYFLLLTGSDS